MCHFGSQKECCPCVIETLGRAVRSGWSYPLLFHVRTTLDVTMISIVDVTLSVSKESVALIPVKHLTPVVRKACVIGQLHLPVMSGSVTIASLRDAVRLEQKNSAWIVMSPCVRSICRYVTLIILLYHLASFFCTHLFVVFPLYWEALYVYCYMSLIYCFLQKGQLNYCWLIVFFSTFPCIRIEK